MMMLAAMLGTPIWAWAAMHFGPIPAWQISSFCTAFSIVLFASSSVRGRLSAAILAAVGIGFTLGSRFLNETVILYVIDYDEFLSGFRNVGLFTMLKSFLLKICYYPACIVPIAIIYSCGLKPNEYMLTVTQSNYVRQVCFVFTVGVPFVLALISCLMKLKYRLVDPVQFDMMRAGIQAHSVGKIAADPLSGEPYLALSKKFSSPEDWKTSQHFSYFPSIHQIVDFRACVEAELPHLGVQLIANKARDFAGFGALAVVGALTGAAVCSRMFYTTPVTGSFALPVGTVQYIIILVRTFAVAAE
jgi:hypothetical protein